MGGIAPARAPGTIWAIRKMWRGTFPNGFVRTLRGDMILLSYHEAEGDLQMIKLSRRDARLLAKRINECLDQTTRR